jgi:hypothetical protein
MKIKFHSNENIELHAPWIGFKFLNWIQIHYLELDQIELNSNSTTFNSTIQLRFDLTQFNLNSIENKMVENVLKMYSWIYGVGKKII